MATMQTVSPALLHRNDLTVFANNVAIAYTEVCISAIINCPGDVVVNNQPGICGNNASWIPPANKSEMHR